MKALTIVFGMMLSQPTAEIRTHDGSSNRVKVLEESITIETRYGKLTVPIAEVRRIDIGVQKSEAIEAKIRVALSKLESEVHRDREQGSRDLVSLGRYAFFDVQRATKHPDLEVSTRAGAVLKAIVENIPADHLPKQEQDVVETRDFPIQGKIVGQGFKCQSEVFESLPIQLYQVRSIRLRHNKDSEWMTVDSARDEWQSSGVDVDTGTRVRIVGEGTVDLWPQGPGQYQAQPKGFSITGKGGVFLAGALLARIGNGQPFFVGEQLEFSAKERGQLFFHIVPSPWNNASSGVYRVKVSAEFGN
jgi:hypothetical protein